MASISETAAMLCPQNLQRWSQDQPTSPASTIAGTRAHIFTMDRKQLGHWLQFGLKISDRKTVKLERIFTCL